MPKISRKPAPDRAAFSERLKDCETRAGGQSALARLAGITQSTIRGYMKRQTEPPRDILIQIAEAAGVSLLWLATGAGPMEPEPVVTPQNPVIGQLDAGSLEIAAAISKKYSVPLEYVVSRLHGSDELEALEKPMRDWRRSRPIPIIGWKVNRIWGVMFQEDLDAAVPGALLKDIKVYRVKTDKMAPQFITGDWAIVDCSKPISDGTYCVLKNSGVTTQVRDITVSPWNTHLSVSRDDLQLDREYEFRGYESLKATFVVVGRLVGAIRLTATK